MTATRSRLLATFVLASAGCENTCDEIAVPGIVLKIVASDGQPVSMATISYTFDGRSHEDMCSDDLVPCSYFEIGDPAGRYEITIEAEGFEAQHLSVDLEHDGCHPITQEHTVALDPI